MGVLHWPPSQFWDSTVWEATRALEGHVKANTIEQKPKPGGLNDQQKSDLKEAMRRHRLKEAEENAKTLKAIRGNHADR